MSIYGTVTASGSQGQNHEMVFEEDSPLRTVLNKRPADGRLSYLDL